LGIGREGEGCGCVNQLKVTKWIETYSEKGRGERKSLPSIDGDGQRRERQTGNPDSGESNSLKEPKNLKSSRKGGTSI